MSRKLAEQQKYLPVQRIDRRGRRVKPMNSYFRIQLNRSKGG
jgi:hypothetical protein